MSQTKDWTCLQGGLILLNQSLTLQVSFNDFTSIPQLHSHYANININIFDKACFIE